LTTWISIVEFYTEDDFRQLVVTAKTMLTFLGGFCELEDHGQSDSAAVLVAAI
jgi:hypothetical protein